MIPTALGCEYGLESSLEQDNDLLPFPVAARSNMWVCGRSSAETAVLFRKQQQWLLNLHEYTDFL
jgi:hypothetical protein